MEGANPGGRPGVLTGRGRGFLAVGVLVLLAGMVLGYPDIMRVGLLLLVLLLLVLVWLRRRTPPIRVTRTVHPARLQPDQRGEVEVTFVNTGRRRTPLYLAEEQLDYALGDRPRFLLPRLHAGEDRRLRYTVGSRQRGAYLLGPVTLRLRDPFGLTYQAMDLPLRTEVLVLPRLAPLGSRGPSGQGRGTEGEIPQMVAQHGEDDISIRQWREGDELRRVHWPTTAHRGELMVRQEDRPSRRRAVLLLDSRLGAHPGDGYHPSYEWAVSALASAARHLVLDGYVVHLLTEGTVDDGSAGHPVELTEAMAVLARVTPRQDAGLHALANAAHTFTSGGVLVVAAVVAHDESDLRDLAAIRDPGSTAVAFVLDPDSFARHRAAAGQQPSERARDLTAVLDASGWRTTTVGPDTEIAAAWEDLRRRRVVSRA